MKKITELTRAEIMEIVNASKINVVVKSVLLSTLRRANDAAISAMLAKLQTMIVAAQSGDAAQIRKMADDLKPQAEKIGIAPNLFDEMLEALKPDARNPIQ